MEHGIIMKSERTFGYFAWPTVARLPDGNLMAVASGFRLRHVCPFGKVVASYSKDEGSTWSNPSVIIDTPLDDRDAGIVCRNGKVYVTTFTNPISLQKKLIDDDKAISDSERQMIDGYLAQIKDGQEKKYLGGLYSVSEDGGYTFGNVKNIPVSAPHGMITLNDGSLYYVGNKAPNDTGRINQIYFVRSYDGINFSEPKQIPIPLEYEEKGFHFVEPHVICLKSGKILLLHRTDGFTMYTQTSYDNGETFTKPKEIGFYGSPPHLMEHSSGALILSYSYRMAPFGQRVRISYDEGETFGEEIVLRDDGFSTDLGYPSSVELKDGSILTVYYQKLDKSDKNASICYTKWKL